MMNNIVHDLTFQLARVENLLKGPIDFDMRKEAQDLLRFGRERMMLNDDEGMLAALTDLREFGNPPSGHATPCYRPVFTEYARDEGPTTLIERWKALGNAGITVSIVYGEMKGRGLSFSVLAVKGDEFFKNPYRAESFEQAIEIAETESRKRGWI